jgi:hypothetical protein
MKAIRKNYTLKDFQFTTLYGPSLDIAWNAPLRKRLDVVCRLNRNGRRYLQSEPSNQHMGFALLEAVSDDVDCIYFHLLENPQLCKVQPVVPSGTKALGVCRKRKAHDG